MMETASQGAIPERIDRLPVGWTTYRIMLLAGIAWFIESYDIGIIGNVLPSLKKVYHIGAFDTGLIAAASTIGIVVSVIPFGWIADRIGRKKVLIIGTAWYAIFSFAAGFGGSPIAIVILRFLAGLGMGAVFPVPYAMASEYMPRSFRGAMTGILDSFLSLGYFIAPLIAFATVPNLSPDLGWRVLFYVGGLPLLYVPVLMIWMPESARWLQVKGRNDEAERIVRGLESEVERRTQKPLPPVQAEAAVVVSEHKVPVSMIFSPAYLKRTIMMWIAFPCILFVFYALQVYTPTVLVKQGYAIGDVFLMTALIVVVSIPGKYFEAYCVERFGRKGTIVWFTVVAAAGAVMFGFSHNAAMAIAFGMVMSFFGIGVDPAIKIYGAEQYPTRVRETGVGFIEGVGRLFGGALAPFIMAFMIGGGLPRAYVFVAVVAVIGALAVLFLGSETKGSILETVSEAQADRPSLVARGSARPSPS
jgi:putative MFS transporter